MEMLSNRFAQDLMYPKGARFSRIAFVAALAAIFLATFAAQIRAERTRHWRQASFEDFSRGTAKGVALRSDGRLELAPRFAGLAEGDCAFLWALRFDSRGNLYAAGGSNAKVLRIDPAGKATTIFESGELTAQALAVDSRDNIYVGTSPDGKVYKISASGEKKVFFEPKTKYTWDLIADSRGTLYVATGDKGQIFAVTPDGKSEIFYSGDETHIRALALDSQNNLIAGTEPNGLILRVPTSASSPGTDTKGTSQTPDKSSRRNGSSATDQLAANIQASNSRKAFVLYETSKKEITSLVSDSAGNIYAAAIGEKQRSFGASSPPLALPSPLSVPSVPGAVTLAQSPLLQPAIFPPFPAAVSSAVFRIAADGAPEEIWNSRDTLVYSLGLSTHGQLLLGTGNDGTIIEMQGGRVFSHLVKVGSSQVTAFTPAHNGKIYLSTANPGKLFTLGPDSEAAGSFESQTFDARIFSEWGRLQWFGDRADGGMAPKAGSSKVVFYVRSGNTSDPGKDWSAWFGPYAASGAKVECPPARFIQWKAQWNAGSNMRSGDASSPQSSPNSREKLQEPARSASDGAPNSRVSGDGLDWVSIAYLPKNVAPVIDAMIVQNAGIRIPNVSATSPSMQQPVLLKMPPQGNAGGGISVVSGPAQGDRASQKVEAAPQGTQQKGFQSVVWSAHDDNDDELIYSVFYRGEGERDWKLLRDKIELKYFSWDTTALPDGAYYLKIVASDAPSNPRSEALKAERESERFEIDNTPPVIEGLSANPLGGRGNPGMRIRFEARDSASAIERAEYSLDGSDWAPILPVGRLSDAPRESYDFSLSTLAAGEHTVAVRVFDHFENMASAKATFLAKSSQ